MKTHKKDRIRNNLARPLTPKAAHHMAGAEARAEYAPTIRTIKGNIRGSKVRQRQIGQEYGGLSNQINESAQKTEQSYNAANAAMKANIEAAARAAQENQAGVAAGNAAFANLTGADADNFAPSMAEASNSAAQRSIAQAALAAPIAQAGASQAAYLRQTGINARHEGIYQRGQEAKRRTSMKQDLTAARQERAQKKVGNFERIRQAEIENNIKRQAFGLEKQSAAADAAKESREARLAAEKNRRENEEQRNQNQEQHNQNESAHKEGKSGGLSPSEKRGVKEGHHNAMSAARTAIKLTGWPKTPKAWAQLEQAVASQSEISPAEASWAIKRLKQRHQKNVKPTIPSTDPFS